MNENNQLKAFIAFLFIFTVMALSQTVSAAVSMAPAVAGLSAGSFSSAAGSFSTAANGASYGVSGVVSVGGKAITVPATLRLAANAGQYVKNGLRLTPAGLLTTAALLFLTSNDFVLDNGEWAKIAVGNAAWPQPIQNSCQQACQSNLDCKNTVGSGSLGMSWAANPTYLVCSYVHPQYGYNILINYGPGYTPASLPATQNDFDSLPDPLPALAPELPFAPYMPDGVPVEAPEYDFAPIDVPLGNPYTKPDGSTAQPRAKVSPNDDTVTVDTYDQPLTDANGQPVPNSIPEDTPEPTQSECEKHPTTIGCSEYGTSPAPESLSTLTVPLNPDYSAIGGAGACPASVTVAGITWSYQPFCDFASAIKPLILGFAWLSFAFIVAGTVRT